jgi:tRNA modification GTPase
MDLAQAEAVSRLIDSSARAGVRSAARELLGGLSARVTARRRAILATLAELEAHVDFPDEDLAGVDRDRLGEALADHAHHMRRLAEGAGRSRGAKERVSVVIVGAPNAGKSSLFNALVGRDRSIVHERPGTTRDVVDAEITLGEIALTLTDTAGIAEGRGEVEAEGIRRSHEAHAAADRVLLVVDGSQAEIDATGAALLTGGDPERTLVVRSKADLPRRLPPGALGGWHPIAVSVVSGEGLDALEARLRREIPEAEVDLGERVGRALEDAATSAARAREVFEGTHALELVAEELRESANALGRVTGERVGTDVLDVIFSRFCIGK